jgi:uncharacterized protein YkwD
VKSPRGILLLFAVIVCALALAAPALASSPLNNYERQLVAAINKERAKHGLSALRLNAKLVDSARGHSADMSARKYFDHDSPDGESWSSRIVRYGYTREGCSYWKAGENIYYGSGLYSSPYVAVRAWMGSKAHRAVILTKTFRDIGVGAVKTEDGYANINGVVWFLTLDVGRRVAQ